MKVIDLIHSNKKTAFSFEILPPLKGTGIEKLYQTIDTLREFDPKYINITTHRSEYVYKDLGNGLFQRNRLRRRPGTVAVAAAIQNKYNITVVPHILCSGFTREETEYVLLDLQFLNITELLVLRGDKAKHESVFTPEGDGYHHAIELQEQINNFNKGIFVDGSEMKVSSTPFSYGVACYPEKHEEAPNIETDLYWLKKKVENGAEYAVTQLFYDNRKYFEFVEQAKAAGINIPIIPYGKIALWAAAQDERFVGVIANSSGSGGASLYRGNRVETPYDIYKRFPHWMCKRFYKYADRVEKVGFPIDQHMVLSLLAPRPMYIANSDEDAYVCPNLEYAALLEVVPIYNLYGYLLNYWKELPATGSVICQRVGYHLKPGAHSMTPFDWRCFYEFADRYIMDNN